MSTVLVIDDEPEILENVVDLLEIEGFEPVATEDAEDGIELAKTHRPDLIVCDVMMPDLSGHDVLQAIRSVDGLQTTPFIFLTAKSTPDDMREGMTLGADDYLTKPFRAAELVSAVKTRLKRHRTFARQREQRLNELRRSMSTALPHEVRTPLVAIQGYAEVIRDDWEQLSPAEGRGMLSEILKATERLTRLTENYAMYAQLEGNTGPDALKDGAPTDVEPVVTAVVEKEASAQYRAGDVRCNLVPGRVALDARYVRRLVAELVNNALKFSDGGTAVVVTGAVEREAYRLQISDVGRGMDPEQVERQGAFLQFDRAEREQQGAGLGLALARKICDQCGGTLTIKSAPDEGTQVDVVLPLVASAEASKEEEPTGMASSAA